MDISIRGHHGSINQDVKWEDVPPFAVLTGRNGAGKSQLLELIAHTFGALRSQNPRPETNPLLQPRPGVDAPKAIITGATFANGEVFHSYSNWQLLGGGAASAEQVKQSLREGFRGPPPGGDATWMASKIAERAGNVCRAGPALVAD
jgi:hypothetical protein